MHRDWETNLSPNPISIMHRNTNTHIEDLQLDGVAFFGKSNFYFAPNQPVPERMDKVRVNGVAQRMSDGTFDFTAKPRKRSRAVLIRKLTHGRLSATHDGCIMLWLKVNKTEGLNIRKTITEEALVAAESIKF